MMDMNAVETIRESVTAVEAARALGLKPDRHGRCACPFHNGKDRNMKLYPGSGGYHCFVCGESGDVFRLVQGVNGYGFKQAVSWLNEAFHLGLTVDRPIDKRACTALENARKRKQMEREQQEALDRAEFDLYTAACKLVNDLEADVERYRPKQPNEWWNSRFCKSLKLLTEARETANALAVEAIGRRRDN